MQKDHYEVGEEISELYIENYSIEQFRIKVSAQPVEPRFSRGVC